MLTAALISVIVYLSYRNAMLRRILDNWKVYAGLQADAVRDLENLVAAQDRIIEHYTGEPGPQRRRVTDARYTASSDNVINLADRTRRP